MDTKINRGRGKSAKNKTPAEMYSGERSAKPSTPKPKAPKTPTVSEMFDKHGIS